jgi:hypothetical protein
MVAHVQEGRAGTSENPYAVTLPSVFRLPGRDFEMRPVFQRANIGHITASAYCADSCTALTAGAEAMGETERRGEPSVNGTRLAGPAPSHPDRQVSRPLRQLGCTIVRRCVG